VDRVADERCMTGFSESARQLVHVAVGAFALLLRVLTPAQAAACAAAALLFNLIVLPRLGRERLFRPGELAARRLTGIAIYPASVLALVLIFPDRLDLVAAAWGILAAGDGVATIVGTRVGGPRWPWNPRKTVAGSLAFFLAGAVAATALAAWTAPAVTPMPSPWFTWLAPTLAAAVAALIETMPASLDDNISVPAAAAMSLWACSLIDPVAAASGLPEVAGRAGWALALNTVVAAPSYQAGTVSRSGTIAGWLVGVVIYLGTGLAGWVLLLTTFLSAAATTRLGIERKRALHIEETGSGRRGAGNVLANCGTAAVASVLASMSPFGHQASLAMTAALVAGASDTVASEIGKAWGRRTFLVTTLSPVPPGTSGAMSLEGTVAGLASAFALAALASLLGLVPASLVWLIVVVSTLAALVESALGATLEGRGVLDNDLLNFLTTTIAAALAVALDRVLS
jgi:uncharacterized protein (TIGR00297 family)